MTVTSMRTFVRKQIKPRVKEIVALAALVALGLATLGAILANQGLQVPEWVPLAGKHRYELKAEFTSSQAVTAGQGQSVEIAGVRVGEITEAKLVDGHAEVTMSVGDRYTELLHPDASMLLRPKTGLNDMTIELDPGTAEGELPDGSTIELASTQVPVNPDEILATLDADTRGFLVALLQGGAKGLGGHGRQLSATLQRLEPASRNLALIGNQLSIRREHIRQSIHNFRLLTEELGNHDQAVSDFVRSSNGILASFAGQERSIRAALKELPGTLRETHGALTGAAQFAEVAKPALRKLTPGAEALAPSLRRARPFLTDSTAPIRDLIRPFTRDVRTPVAHLSQAAQALGGSIPPLDTSLTRLNEGLNALSYNPPGQDEGFLFYLPWMNHDTNSLFFTQDAHGPLRRGIVMLSCSTARIAESVVAGRPFLKTVLQGTRAPSQSGIC